MCFVYYLCQMLFKFLWQKQKEVFFLIGSVLWWWLLSSSVVEGISSVFDFLEEIFLSLVFLVVDVDIKSYGGIQEDYYKVVSGMYEEYEKCGNDQENYRDVGYDMFKVSKFFGDE